MYQLALLLIATCCVAVTVQSFGLQHAPTSKPFSLTTQWTKININRFTLQKLYASDNNEDYNEGYTQKQILKEETEAPYRKVRVFGYFALLGAAGIGSLVSLTKVLALNMRGPVVNIPGVTDDTYLNLFINLAGLPVLLYLLKREDDSRKNRLERIAKGGSLAGLQVKYEGVMSSGGAVIKLSDFRRDRGIDKRVVIVAATKDLLQSSLQTSIGMSESIIQNDLVIVPLAIDNTSDINSYRLSSVNIASLVGLSEDDNTTDLTHLCDPVAINNWNKVIKNELLTALKQQPTALEKGITLIIKKNGKVGSRRFGVPIWESLVEDVEVRREMGMDVSNI